MYQIGFQAIAPIVDITILWSLHLQPWVINPADQQPPDIRGCCATYWARLLDCRARSARWSPFNLDREDKKPAGPGFPLQRFGYRQIMYYVIVKSHLGFAARGSIVGWGKLERKGTVQQPIEAARPVKLTQSETEDQMAPD